ncbi:MAG TPA: glycosyltransferase family 4 protein [Candidatus Binatia bacterium]|jgi:glycosyltransferase involved in cell wall biosynthesis|nr:glycosyltransferase family 4 protein [Candidatus Binatia bacterium]
MDITCIYGTGPVSSGSARSVPRLLAQLLEGLSARQPDWSFHVLCPGGGTSNGLVFEDIHLNRTEHILRRLRGSQITDKQLWVRKAISSFNRIGGSPGVIVCATVDAVITTRQLMPEAKIVYWIHSHPGYSGLDGDRQTLRAAECADMVVVPSKAMYLALWELYIGRGFPAPVRVIPNWVDTTLFCLPSADEKTQWRNKFGIASDEFAIAHIGGSDNPRKGLRIVEHALLFSPPKKKVVMLSVGGNTPKRRKVADGLEIVDLGLVPPTKVARVFQACDLGVVPSVSFECFGLAAIEMMASGLCVVSSGTGGLKEVVQPKITGLQVDLPNEIEAWAGALERCMADPQLRIHLGQGGRDKVVREFDGRQSMLKWQHLLGTIVRHKNVSSSGYDAKRTNQDTIPNRE